jgi:hypothetical protein
MKQLFLAAGRFAFRLFYTFCACIIYALSRVAVAAFWAYDKITRK